MSSANRVAMRYAASESDGTPITTPGDMVEFPSSGESLQQNTTTGQSANMRSDRQVEDVFRATVASAGDVNFNLLYGAFDQQFEAVLQSLAWTTPTSDVAGSDIQAVASGTKLISGTVNAFTGVALGSLVRISGYATAGNNGYARVEAISTTTLADDTLELSKIALTDEAAGPSVTVEFGARIENGTRQQQFSIEREYEDLTNNFARFIEKIADTLSLSMTPGEAITGSIGFVGKREESATATLVTGSTTPAPANPVMNGVDGVKDVWEGPSDDIIGQCVKSFSLEVVNNSTPRNCLGVLGPDSHGSGTCVVTGSMTMLYEDATLANKHLDFEQSALWIVIGDSLGNAYAIELPALRYTSSPRVAGGSNQDVDVELNFETKRDSTEDFTIRIHRMAA